MPCEPCTLPWHPLRSMWSLWSWVVLVASVTSGGGVSSRLSKSNPMVVRLRPSSCKPEILSKKHVFPCRSNGSNVCAQPGSVHESHIVKRPPSRCIPIVSLRESNVLSLPGPPTTSNGVNKVRLQHVRLLFQHPSFPLAPQLSPLPVFNVKERQRSYAAEAARPEENSKPSKVMHFLMAASKKFFVRRPAGFDVPTTFWRGRRSLRACASWIQK